MRWSPLVVLVLATTARAGVVEPEQRDDDEFDIMNVLARRHLHDLTDESWNAYGQVTWIQTFKLPFSAAYTNLDGSSNSLSPDYENSFTGTATVYAGAKLWPGAELYIAPEMVSEKPLSGLHGLAGVIQNFELQKGGTPTPIVYIGRLYLQQTFNLGGGSDAVASNPLQLGKHQDKRRIVLSAGRFSVLDFFDKNSYSGDLRRQMFDMAFMTYAAYDFAADTRGYTIAGVAELYWDDWIARIGRAAPPTVPNGSDLDLHFWRYYGDQFELEHHHSIGGHEGAVRVLGFHSHENMGRFADATLAYEEDPSMNASTCGGAGLYHYGSTNMFAPDLCWVRKPNDKYGIGINAEQAITPDLGLFLRAMVADGDSEVYAFTATDRSLSLGALADGKPWCRRNDYAGVGFGANGISDAHATYLKLGGVDGFIGDGKLTPGTEMVAEAFYGANLYSSIWLSADYQLIVHPAFNVDRGPVNIFNARFHAEF